MVVTVRGLALAFSVGARWQVRVHQLGAPVQSEIGDQLLGLLATVDVQLGQLPPAARMLGSITVGSVLE